jgi:hypothetical protein
MKPVTLQEMFDCIPMGLGGYALGLIEMKAPGLAAQIADKMEAPISGVRMDFADGTSIAMNAADLLEGENAEASDQRPGDEGDSGTPLGAPGLAG